MVPATDSKLPTASPPNPWPATVPGDPGYVFRILYSDVDTAFALGSFDGGDLEVRAPDGAVLPVALVEKSASNFNRMVLATYRVTPPGGAWNVDDTGAYAVKVRAGQVLGAPGAAMAETAVGSFTHYTELLVKDMSANPGFTIGPGWAWGTPTGEGGTASGSGRDPASGFTGAQVLGTNLIGNYAVIGNYAANAAAATATSPVFGTTGYQKLSVNYWRWLSVDDPVAVEYRVGSGAWKNLWINDFGYDTQWGEALHPLPPECDHQAQVQVRWTIGPTGEPNSLRPRGGWNIDDIRVLAGERFAPGRMLISWSPISRFSLTEGGPSRTYILRLDRNPGASTPVTVNLSSARGSGDLTHPASVVIDSTNWSTGRVVNVSAAQNTARPVNGATAANLNVTVGSGTGRYWVRVARRLAALSTFVEDSRTALVAPLTGYAAWKHALLGQGYT